MNLDRLLVVRFQELFHIVQEELVDELHLYVHCHSRDFLCFPALNASQVICSTYPYQMATCLPFDRLYSTFPGLVHTQAMVD